MAFVVVGFVGRLLLMSNANLIGLWVDSFCHAPAVCRPIPAPAQWLLQGLSNTGYLVLLSSVTMVGFCLTLVYRIGFSHLSAHAVSQFYDEVTLRTSRLPLRFFDQNPVGRIVTRFSSDYANVFRLFGGPLAELFAIIFDLLVMIILITAASPYYLPVFLGIALLNYVLYRLNVESLRVVRRDLSASRSPSIAHFAETAQGASTIRAFARQLVFFQRFYKLNNIYLDEKRRTTRVATFFSFQMSASTALLLLVTGLVGYYLASTGKVSVGSIGVAFTFIVLSGSSLQMFFEWMAQFEEAMTGVERLDDYLRRDLEPGARLPFARRFATQHPVYTAEETHQVAKLKLTYNRAGSVRFRNVWLKYGDDQPMILKGVDFTIQAGEKVGIVGRTGSGKTSLIQALFYLYPIERTGEWSGSITIDGFRPRISEVEVEGRSEASDRLVDIRVYRRSIALISQEPTLFRGTVRENLDLENLHSDASLVDAMKRVGLGHWFDSTASTPSADNRDAPAAVHSALAMPIEERGRNLSSGERQLLCMARCLLQDAPVIVMDEATSSVDPQSEEVMVRATREFFKGRTQLVIAHRLSTIEDCDRILWLENGMIKMFDKPALVIPQFRASREANSDQRPLP